MGRRRVGVQVRMREETGKRIEYVKEEGEEGACPAFAAGSAQREKGSARLWLGCICQDSR